MNVEVTWNRSHFSTTSKRTCVNLEKVATGELSGLQTSRMPNLFFVPNLRSVESSPATDCARSLQKLKGSQRIIAGPSLSVCVELAEELMEDCITRHH